MREEELRLLARHRDADAVHGAVLPARSTDPHLPEGRARRRGVPDRGRRRRVARGKEVFADTLRALPLEQAARRCPPGLDLENCNGKDYLGCWNRYWAWTKTDDFKTPMRQIVLADDFLKDNYLSTELRVPSTLLQTNVCSPLATNAIAGNIWDNFSSQSYKELPSVGSVKVRHPVTGAEYDYPLPGGGRGFTRPASLVSLWSTAPFLQNNSVGPFDPSPSVEARMRVFQDSIEQMLWPERREKDPIFANDTSAGRRRHRPHDSESEIWVPRRATSPTTCARCSASAAGSFPFLFRDGAIVIGPIPPGYPVNLLANIDLLGPDDRRSSERAERKKTLLRRAQAGQGRRSRTAATPSRTRRPCETFLSLSKCPDFVVNKGHYFGTNLLTEEPALSDADKRALIAFLKTF